jgi:hypothetical protein
MFLSLREQLGNGPLDESLVLPRHASTMLSPHTTLFGFPRRLDLMEAKILGAGITAVLVARCGVSAIRLHD